MNKKDLNRKIQGKLNQIAANILNKKKPNPEGLDPEAKENNFWQPHPSSPEPNQRILDNPEELMSGDDGYDDGACCRVTLGGTSYCEMKSESSCNDVGGSYMGYQVPCEDVNCNKGACCDGKGHCFMKNTEQECHDDWGDDWEFHQGKDCEPLNPDNPDFLGPCIKEGGVCCKQTEAPWSSVPEYECSEGTQSECCGEGYEKCNCPYINYHCGNPEDKACPPDYICWNGRCRCATSFEGYGTKCEGEDAGGWPARGCGDKNCSDAIIECIRQVDTSHPEYRIRKINQRFDECVENSNIKCVNSQNDKSLCDFADELCACEKERQASICSRDVLRGNCLNGVFSNLNCCEPGSIGHSNEWRECSPCDPENPPAKDSCIASTNCTHLDNVGCDAARNIMLGHKPYNDIEYECGKAHDPGLKAAKTQVNACHDTTRDLHRDAERACPRGNAGRACKDAAKNARNLRACGCVDNFVTKVREYDFWNCDKLQEGGCSVSDVDKCNDRVMGDSGWFMKCPNNNQEPNDNRSAWSSCRPSWTGSSRFNVVLGWCKQKPIGGSGGPSTNPRRPGSRPRPTPGKNPRSPRPGRNP